MPPLTEASRAIRAGNVGASEVAAILGEHPYLTAYQVFSRIAYGTQQPTSEAMAIGSSVESGILEYAAMREGWHVRANRRTIVHPRARLCATPDAYLIDSHPRTLVEVKWSGQGWAWTKGLPRYVYWQAQAQMAVTGYRRVLVAALVGSGLQVIGVDASIADIRRLLREVRRFDREHLQTGIEPDHAPRILTI